MEQKGRKLLADQLGVPEDRLLLWQVYTSDDVLQRQRQLTAARDQRSQKRSATENSSNYIFFSAFLHFSISNFL